MNKFDRIYKSIINQSVNYDAAPTDLVAKAIEKFKGKEWADCQHVITAVANDQYVKSCYNDYIEAKENGEENPEQYLQDMEDQIQDWLLNWSSNYEDLVYDLYDEQEKQMFAIDTDLFRKFKDIYKQWDPASFDNMTEQDFLDDYKQMLKAGYTPKQIVNFTFEDLDKWYLSNEEF